MSQADIIKYLKKRKTWATASQMSRKLGITRSTVSANLTKLSERREIKKKLKAIWPREYIYKC